MKPPITWPSGVTSAVSLTFDLDAETAWISRDLANLDRLSVLSQGAYGPKVGVPVPAVSVAKGLSVAVPPRLPYGASIYG